jgi:hypothetical protein
MGSHKAWWIVVGAAKVCFAYMADKHNLFDINNTGVTVLPPNAAKVQKRVATGCVDCSIGGRPCTLNIFNRVFFIGPFTLMAFFSLFFVFVCLSLDGCHLLSLFYFIYNRIPF